MFSSGLLFISLKQIFTWEYKQKQTNNFHSILISDERVKHEVLKKQETKINIQNINSMLISHPDCVTCNESIQLTSASLEFICKSMNTKTILFVFIFYLNFSIQFRWVDVFLEDFVLVQLVKWRVDIHRIHLCMFHYSKFL